MKKTFSVTSISFSRIFLISLLILTLPACVVGPDYVSPETATEANFSSSFDAISSNQVEVQWWKLFEDPQLQSLIDKALLSNKDIAIAKARLEESRELLSSARYDYFPTITANGSYENSQISKQQTRGLAQADRRTDVFRLGFDALWELDIFGGVTRANEQREALLEANEASLRDIVVSLIAEIGRNYIQLRGDQNRLLVAKRNAQNQTETLKLTQARLEGGQATELDTSRARAQLNNTFATIPPLQAAVKTGIFRLSVLLGEQPSALEPELKETKDLPKLPDIIASGDPKSLLQRRPDVRVAERNLAAAVAQVGIATADLYPHISFEGNIGYASGSPRDFFDSDFESWTFGPSINWAAFNLGRVRALLRASDASAQASLGVFELTVLEALEETERAFVFFNASRQTTAYLSESAQASSKAAELANLRYRDGVTDFITVLDAERTMLEAQDRLAQSRTDTATSLIAVYKALGGGWETIVDPKPVQEQVASILP